MKPISAGIKFFIGWFFVFALRLLPHPPNVEPIMATLMPYSKRYGAYGGFAFAFLSIVLFDSVTSGIGMWTWLTACTYGVIGASAYLYFRNRKNSAWNYVGFGIVATLFFDAVTGLSFGPLFYGQPFTQALIGQIPFTINHLLGNIVLSAIVSPALYRWVVESEALEAPSILRRLGLNRG